MCGIAGYFKTPGSKQDHADLLNKMGQAILHRGPDSGDIWFDENLGIGFSHRRLKIIDLSEMGNQPMHSHCGRFVAIYNGEIYNFQDIRNDLIALGQNFRGHSDTEVLVQAIAQWGLKTALIKCNGMFALALWDRENQTLSLARDRFGKKPIYYGSNSGKLFFGSELSALKCHPQFKSEISNEAISHLMRYGVIPAPLSIYRDVFKLMPGHILEFGMDFNGEMPAAKPYWSLIDDALAGMAERGERSHKENIEHIHEILRDATKNRMISDVPIGSFLSSGIDSSLVTALMQEQSNQKIKSFCVAFEGSNTTNEGAEAALIAKHLGTEHTEIRLSTQDLTSLVTKLPDVCGEPFADPSLIPSLALCQKAREYVTVGLTGDGGDEMFRGYPIYFGAEYIWNRTHKVPKNLRKLVGKGLRGISPQTLDKLNKILPGKVSQRDLGNKLHKSALALGSDTFEEMHYKLVSRWQNPSDAFKAATACHTIFEDSGSLSKFTDPTERLILQTTLMQLPDDMLTKVDRASMQVALELRSPLLDYRLVKATWAMSQVEHFTDLSGKLVLKEIIKKYIPEELTNRPKVGFNGPVDQWLRNDLRDWAESLLDAKHLESEGFNQDAILQLWRSHLSGARQNELRLWPILMFLQWKKNLETP